MKKNKKIIPVIIVLLIISIILLIMILLNLIKNKNDYLNQKRLKEEKEEQTILSREYNIEKNENNKIYEYEITDETYMWMILNNFTDYCLHNPEEAYKLLNEEYKKARFKNIEGFKEYLQDANKTLQEAYLDKYIKKEYKDYIEYTIIDQNQNYYIFKCYGGYNYEVMLDIYTVQTQTYLYGYSKGNAEARVKSNIKKFIEMINSKDYSNAYDKLAESFKKNSYPTKEDFKKFLKEKMYEYSEIEFEEFKSQGNLYIYNIKLSERDAPAHPVKNMQIIMKLKEGIDFELSFNME